MVAQARSALRHRSAVLPAAREAIRRAEWTPIEQFFWDEQAELERFMRRAFCMLVYNGVGGDYAEFGCFGARTFTLAASVRDMLGHGAHLWAFDSFAGLPPSADPRDAHLGWNEGEMAMTEPDFVAACEAGGVRQGSFTTVAGFYSETLTATAPARPLPERVCFAYVDCDLYSSTTVVLDFLSDRLCHGAVVAFDDYYCYSETHPAGERLAALERLAAHPRWRLVPYCPYGWHGMSFVVEARPAAEHPPLAH